MDAIFAPSASRRVFLVGCITAVTAAGVSRAFAAPSVLVERRSSPTAVTGGGAIFAHVKCKPGKSAYLEDWVAFMVRNTRFETLCTRYEIWRGSDLDTYYVMECFSDANGFFIHQASSYHIALGLAMRQLDVIENMRVEWIDPAGAAHAQFPPTTDKPLPRDASVDVKREKENFPVREAPWWLDLRRRNGTTSPPLSATSAQISAGKQMRTEAMIIGHYKVHPGKARRFEEVVGDDVRNTALEPGCTRFELWRGSEPNTYYVSAGWVDENAFAFHNAAPYHDRLAVLDEEGVIQEAKWEWVDSAGAAHKKFAPTTPTDKPLPADAPEYVREWKAKVGPVREASWWSELRRRYPEP